ncbi:hypothetical protein ABW19_dt0203081 [Dactylella cylindrospora]|nr:hypothetical protein ABW19_dt0203081 [Dactylella cylindrospora]
MSFPHSNHERQPSGQPKSSKRKKSKKSSSIDDDTPKAFSRLMAYAATRKLPNGLDDPKPKSSNSTSNSNTKKRKRSDITNTASNLTPSTTNPSTSASTSTASRAQDLHLLPGEKLSDFSRRVDKAIPISFKGLQRGEDNPKSRKKQKKAALAAAAEAAEEAENEITEDSYDFDDNGDPLPNHLKPHNHHRSHNQNHLGNSNKTSKKKQRSPSPFSELREKRGAVQSSINDVVQAPPTLIVPKERLRAKGLEVPKSSGSLARREMLEEERKGVVERYRALMAAKGGGL